MTVATLREQEAVVKQLPSKTWTGPAVPQPHHILVVDDEEDLLELVRYNLSKEGYEVTCVSSGEEALKAARKQPPRSDRARLDAAGGGRPRGLSPAQGRRPHP